MDTKEFENKLQQMSKPEIDTLKHEQMLANAIANAKDKSVVSWWWLLIPLYVIATLMMKSFFMPATTLVSNLHDFASKQKIPAAIFFMIVPSIFIIVNFFTIRKVHFLSGSPRNFNFLERVWYNVLVILLGIIVIIFYLL